MKFYFSILVIAVFLNISTSSQNILNCESFSNLDDKQIILFLKNTNGLSKNFFVENYKSCIEILIFKGHFDALEFFLNELLKRGIKFKEFLNTYIEKYNKSLSGLKNKFKFKETDYQKAVPAIRWAQNKEYVFLEIKFSHRHDSPGNY